MQQTYENLSVNLNPALGKLDLVLTLLRVEREELPVGHRTPLDLERGDVDRALGVLVVPAERVAEDIRGLILILRVIVAQSDFGRTESYCLHLRLERAVPGFGEDLPRRRGESVRRKGASTRTLQQHVEQCL